MNRRSSASLLAVIALFVATEATAQSNCAIQDPISGKCLATGGAIAGAVENKPAARGVSRGSSRSELPITGPYGQVSAPSGQPGSLGGVSERSGYFECAVYDKERQRCKVKASSAEEREQALQVGIEAGRNGAKLLHEVQVRAGLIPPSAQVGKAPLAGPTSLSGAASAIDSQVVTGAAKFGSPDADSYTCVQRQLTALGKRLKRAPTAEETIKAMKGCEQ